MGTTTARPILSTSCATCAFTPARSPRLLNFHPLPRYVCREITRIRHDVRYFDFFVFIAPPSPGITITRICIMRLGRISLPAVYNNIIIIPIVTSLPAVSR